MKLKEIIDTKFSEKDGLMEKIDIQLDKFEQIKSKQYRITDDDLWELNCIMDELIDIRTIFKSRHSRAEGKIKGKAHIDYQSYRAEGHTAKDSEVYSKQIRDEKIALNELNNIIAEHIKLKMDNVQNTINLIKYHVRT